MGSFYGVLNHIELSYYKKRAIRLITNSSYTAHTTPLFIELGLPKVQNMFKLKLLKFTINCLLIYYHNFFNLIVMLSNVHLLENGGNIVYTLH